jgi:biofilm PGA synthesis N-glycosyltransferase PgaC
MMSALTFVFAGLVFYVYVGYPALVTLLGSLVRFRTKARPDFIPHLSLVIAAYNEEDCIGKKLDNSLVLTYPKEKLQIIVVADGSEDRTAEIVCGYADRGVRLLHDPNRMGKSAALNRAVSECVGDVVVFSDANAMYDKGAVLALARHFADPTVGCVSGSKTVTKGGVGQAESVYWRYESHIRKMETACGSTVGVVGEINAVRRSLFAPIASGVINDDAFLALHFLAAGRRVIYEPSAVSVEAPSASAADESLRRRRIIAGRYQLLFSRQTWKGLRGFPLFALISHKFFRLLLPFFMLLAFVFNLLALLLDGLQTPLLALSLAQLLSYGAAISGLSPQAKAIRPRMVMVCSYILRSNIDALQGLAHYLAGQATPLWPKASRLGPAGP